MKIPPGLIGVFGRPRILLGELKVESELPTAAARRRPRVRASEAAACTMPFGGHGGRGGWWLEGTVAVQIGHVGNIKREKLRECV